MRGTDRPALDGLARPTHACKFGVPDLELAMRRGEIGAELVVELRDRRTLLEDLILDPAVGIAHVPVSFAAIERSSAFLTRHVARPQHLCERSAAVSRPLAC
jgi:hypothetical protein